VTKNFFTLLIFSLFFIAVVFTSSCSAPIGGLLHGGYIRAAPIRVLYDQNHWFKPANDVEVFGVFGGQEELIDINKVKIKLINENPDIESDIIFDIADNQAGIPLLNKGVKTVVINYNGMEARYPIVVGEPGTSSWIEQDGTGGKGIIIIWK
jgi:hypothetical protein